MLEPGNKELEQGDRGLHWWCGKKIEEGYWYLMIPGIRSDGGSVRDDGGEGLVGGKTRGRSEGMLTLFEANHQLDENRVQQELLDPIHLHNTIIFHKKSYCFRIRHTV